MRDWAAYVLLASVLIGLAIGLAARVARWRATRTARQRDAAEPLGWRRFLLMGPPQPRGQAALVDLDVQIGEDLYDGETTYRVADIDVTLQGHGQRRAWLVNITDRHRDRLRALHREQLMVELEAELHNLVLEAVRPIFGRPPTDDIPSIASYWAAEAIGREASLLTWSRYEVHGAADLPRDVLPRVEVDGSSVIWDVKPLARWMAGRVRDYG